MLAALVLLAAASPGPAPTTPAPPTIAVVHDAASLAEAQAAAAHLGAGGKVTAAARETPLGASCVHTTACPDRPKADDILVVTSAGPGQLHLELVDRGGATVTTEAVTVSDPALLDAALAPALERIAAAAVARASSPSSTSSSSSGAAEHAGDEGGNGWLPWVLGGAGVCAGVCALGIGAIIVAATVQGATAAGDAAGNACGDALGKACTAPFDALGNACASLGDVGNSCAGAGDSLGNACSSVGDIGSCAVMPGLAPSGTPPGPLDETGPRYAPGAMRY